MKIAQCNPHEDVFAGDLTCDMCGVVGPEGDKRNRLWRAIEAVVETSTGELTLCYHFCPTHFPPDSASVEEFRAAYVAVLEALVQKGREVPNA